MECDLFFTNKKDLLEKIRNKREVVANKDRFNIFSTLSEIYSSEKNIFRKENPNSEIIKFLIDPNSYEEKNRTVLNKFFDFIDLKDYITFFPDNVKVEIERENHRIDLYIHNKENAIIIESKLNNAPDQDFQLARYYLKATKDDGFNVKKIVYLTLNPITELNLEKLYKPSESKKYTHDEQKGYYEAVKDIKPLIVYISAVDDGNPQKSLSNFFENCAKATDDKIMQTLLNQYSKLLRQLAGEEKMTEEEIKLIENIYNSKDCIQNAVEFQKVWENKDAILRKIFENKFWSFSDWTYDKGKSIYLKTVNGYALYIWFQEKHDKNNPIQQEIGFWSEKTKKKWNKEKLKGILIELAEYNNGIKLAYEDPYADDEWVCIAFVYDAETENNPETIDTYFNKFFNVVKNFESKVEKEL